MWILLVSALSSLSLGVSTLIMFNLEGIHSYLVCVGREEAFRSLISLTFSHLHVLFLPDITRQTSWQTLVPPAWSSRVLCGSQRGRLLTWQPGACSYSCQSSIGPYSSSGGCMPWLQARLETKLPRWGVCLLEWNIWKQHQCDEYWQCWNNTSLIMIMWYI